MSAEAMAEAMKEVDRALADDSSEAYRVARRTELTDALEIAAVRLRDAELEKRAAGKAYAEALEAFNRFVAPVPAP